ncbi:hypothetical protein GCM10022396_20940 [Flavivirga amylovorans]
MSQTTSHRVKSILLLLVFTLLKIGVAHSLSHAFSHDDLDDCEQCILIVDSNKIKAFGGHSYSYSSDVINIVVLPKPYNLHYKNPQFREHHYVFFFNKPPPSL